MVSFIVNGVIKPVIVDEWLPLFFGEEYTKKKSGAIWHFLLEKAWAKLNGSYMRTVQDDAKITSQHFLGMRLFLLITPRRSTVQSNSSESYANTISFST